ncbi:MAG: hypothetical protein MST09_05880 [Spirochaetia bacterium]|nr:hypothetical protein [Spirochaetia bacterium]
MKKLLAVLISLSVMAGSAFARETYNGDVQLHIGTGADSMKYTVNEYSDDSYKSNTFDFDIASWHLFSLNDLFGVGFMIDLNGGIGGTKEINSILESSVALHFNALIGPAASFTFGNIASVNVAAGLAFGVPGFSYKVGNQNLTFSSAGIGFGAEVNGKFFPKSKVSPLAGFRFSTLGSKTYSFKVGDGDIKTQDVDSISIINSEFFVGVAFNF